MKTAVHWFRRDLRIADNTGLIEAIRQAQHVWPLFILDDAILGGADMGAARVAFLLESIRSLERDLAGLGRPLTIRRGLPEPELVRFCREVGAEAVFCNRDYEPYCSQRDTRIFNALNGLGIGFEIFKDSVLCEDQDLLTQSGRPFAVFTPYSKAWKGRPVPPPRPRPARCHPPARSPASVALPDSPAAWGFPLRQTICAGGEPAARKCLSRFLRQSVRRYGEQRDYPALDGTSLLSPHLHFGTINVRTILKSLRDSLADASAAEHRNADVFVSQLIWREFYLQILWHFPRVATACFRTEYDRLEWKGSASHFQAWCAGQTGYPIVDAAMRCLNATGWMHNRARMIVAMFLAKDLLLPWQQGEQYFMRQLVDGDLAANNGGWQWCAGTGTDAAPYFRIFNPVSQGERFDPEGAFVRSWVPELAGLESRYIHRPWEAPSGSAELKRYPPRIVRHEEQRPRCLAMFQAVKKMPSPQSSRP